MRHRASDCKRDAASLASRGERYDRRRPCAETPPIPRPPTWRPASASGMKFGLETMRALLDALGHPRARVPVAAGRGHQRQGLGRGLCGRRPARRAACASAATRRPHLVRVNERITVGGRAITDRALDRAVDAVRAAAEALAARGTAPRATPPTSRCSPRPPSCTSSARRVEVAVLEVGMGGRLDATNVVEPLGLRHRHRGSAITRPTSARRWPPSRARRRACCRRGRVTVLGPMAAPARRRDRQGRRRPAARAIVAGARRRRRACLPFPARIRSPTRRSR